MKLGQLHPSKYRKCSSCNKVILNIRYNKCYQYYNKKKFKESQIQLTSNITEYYSSNKESTI